MGNTLKVAMMIMLATCAQLIMTQSDSTDGNEVAAVAYGHLEYSDVAVLAATATCSATGVFRVPGNCSLFQVCTPIGSGNFLSSLGDCENLNFDPGTLECSSTYVCSNCTEPGFYCNTNTTFTLCAAAGVSIVDETVCPSGYYCNQKCISPCLNYIPDC
ncbi:uncharacterized protein LOC111871512 isoform X2 [Cryptotermes secundus]|uniref:uncharacterized protein LOC111871512 isoform X2 n=1 Tax=Cryptotermes secundus TaxID=105785 RepID=UPI000CD7AD51|nr:uncharacterized protein LOC111871512 isoform X2 [Cryptotermes secundus]